MEHFLEALAPLYENVLKELGAGRKKSHWMWFIFPQLASLGRSPMAWAYALKDTEEARAYLAHPVLGARLRECTSLVLATQGKTAHEIFGSPDDLKFHSSMTLFALAAEDDETCFAEALTRFFDGEKDDNSLKLLRF